MTQRDQITITITRDAAGLLQEAIASGGFRSPSDAIREVFLGWKAQREDLGGYSPEEMDRLIDIGLASGPGQELDIAEIKREVRRRSNREG